MSKYTDWYPADVKPVHFGVYEVKRFRYHGDKPMPIHRGLWTGHKWVYAEDFELMPAGGHMSMTSGEGDQWRGLKEPA